MSKDQFSALSDQSKEELLTYISVRIQLYYGVEMLKDMLAKKGLNEKSFLHFLKKELSKLPRASDITANVNRA